MKTIHLHTAHVRMTEAGIVFADAGEDLIVGAFEEGGEITPEKAQELVDQGGAVEVDPLDHDHNGKKGGAKKPPVPPADAGGQEQNEQQPAAGEAPQA